MTIEGLCAALQAKIDELQEVVDETRNGECDLEGLWVEFDRVCQEIAYLSEAAEDGDLGEDDDEEDGDEDSEDGGELDFEDGDADSDAFDEED